MLFHSAFLSRICAGWHKKAFFDPPGEPAFENSIVMLLEILWATPSAAGPRSLPIASGLQILGIVASGSWYFWDANLLFGMIVGFTLASWGTWADFGKLGSITTETLRSRPGF